MRSIMRSVPVIGVGDGTVSAASCSSFMICCRNIVHPITTQHRRRRCGNFLNSTSSTMGSFRSCCLVTTTIRHRRSAVVVVVGRRPHVASVASAASVALGASFVSSSSASSSRSLTSTTSISGRPTLFDLPNLSHPSDFIELARTAIRECDSIRHALAASLHDTNNTNSYNDTTNIKTTHHPNDPNDDDVHDLHHKILLAKWTLHSLDQISNVVCTVIDAAELCRSVHASPKWRKGAEGAFGMLSEYIGSLNADESLYWSLRRHVFRDSGVDDGAMGGRSYGDGGDGGGGKEDTNGILLSHLPPAYQRMAHAMRREFERDGIHLPRAKREEARELQNEIVGLETQFSRNITEKIKYYAVSNDGGGGGEDLVGEVHKVVPRHILGQLIRGSPHFCGKDENNGDHSSITLSTDNLLTNTLLAHSPSPTLRKQIYYEANTSLPENLIVLDSLIRHRHLHSTLLGYPSYAHRVLSDRMVRCPTKVMEFLERMEGRNRRGFVEEMESMKRAKRYVEGGDSNVEPWDIPFYTTFLKAQRRHRRWKESFREDDDDDGSHRDEEEDSLQFSGYFTVENSFDGMKMLVNDLFGITMEEVPIPIEERWDIDTAQYTQHPNNDAFVDLGGGGGGDLRKFVFHHPLDGPLGTMYFDLHPREGKFVHAAHFTIRCGRIREEGEFGTDGRADDAYDADDADNANSKRQRLRQLHQLPIVALVCNLSPTPSPSSSPASAISSSSQTLLSHSEVETLYHEFGHGLHSLLSRTPFQHLSGTRASMDFVETPSHLMEYFSRDANFVSKVLARHYVTGKYLGIKKARLLERGHDDFRGVEIQLQIVHSRLDQALFGTRPSLGLGGCSSSTEMSEKLHLEAGVPYAKGTFWHARFGHLVTYGAGYYGYLYAQTFASDVWVSCLKERMKSMGGGDIGSSSSSSSSMREEGMKIWKEMLIHGGAKDPMKMLVAVLGRERKEHNRPLDGLSNMFLLNC